MPEATQTQLRAEELLNELLTDPKLGADVRAKAKAKYTDVTFVEDRIDPMVSGLREELAALKAERDADKAAREAEKAAAEEARATSTLENAIASARSKYALNDEGFEKMVQRMKDTGNVADAEAAAAWVVQNQPPPAKPGPTWGAADLNLFGSSQESQDAKVRLLHTNPERFFDQEVSEILNEFREDPESATKRERAIQGWY